MEPETEEERSLGATGTLEMQASEFAECRIGWRRPENQRWDRKLLTEMNGEPWNTSPRQRRSYRSKTVSVLP